MQKNPNTKFIKVFGFLKKWKFVRYRIVIRLADW